MGSQILGLLGNALTACSQWFYELLNASGLVPLVITVTVFAVFARLILLPLIGGDSIRHEPNVKEYSGEINDKPDQKKLNEPKKGKGK